MTLQALQENINSHLEAIDLCLKNHHRMPALLLIYSGIDIFGSLSRPKGTEEVTRAVFLAWTTKYLLPNGNMSCSALDLYAARCAIVHTYTASSLLSRTKKAKEIVYAWGNRYPEELQKVIDDVGINHIIVIHIETLADAFRKGIKYFIEDINNDKELFALVSSRTGQLFKNQSSIP